MAREFSQQAIDGIKAIYNLDTNNAGIQKLIELAEVVGLEAKAKVAGVDLEIEGIRRELLADHALIAKAKKGMYEKDKQ